MTRRSLEIVQQAIGAILEERHSDCTTLGAILDHSEKMVRALRHRHNDELAKMQTEYTDNRIRLEELFDHLIDEEIKRQDMLKEQIKLLNGDEVKLLKFEQILDPVKTPTRGSGIATSLADKFHT